ncbi:hypothetical protein BZG36_02181 [Bifiguratus adelaidae]|uniref:Uncharacterized protein n=1 Tax=Bifiguratus adelaidae TaxID=1938954 RepID=A0A261Y0P3_9FUNG|nr:hypothetical protein BZG36_02181 [Bifiguratus adelaidae]
MSWAGMSGIDMDYSAWLKSTDPPRIKHYPYPPPPPMWSAISVIPQFFQHEFCKFMAMRMLRLNTSPEYFPDQFLIGASLAIRKVLAAVSSLTYADKKANASTATTQPLKSMLTSSLYDRLKASIKGLPQGAHVDISISNLYDATIRDVWVTMGSKQSTYPSMSNAPGVQTFRWMTVTLGLRKGIVDGNDDDDGFRVTRNRVAKGLLDGVEFKVDVEIDADVEYTVSKSRPKANPSEEEGRDILLYDFGRRTMLVRFESPYFEPAEQMVGGISNEQVDDTVYVPPDLDKRMQWTWKVGDIDYLLEKDRLEKIADRERERDGERSNA